MGPRPIRTATNRRRVGRRGAAVAVALAASLGLAACGSSGASSGPTASVPDPSETPSAAPAEPAPPSSETPTPSGSPDDVVDVEVSNVRNLCEALDLRALIRLTGIRLRPGEFDGTACTWSERGGDTTLLASLYRAKATLRYIDELKELDAGEAVTVAGAQAAAAVSITTGSGQNRSTRIAVVARVGHSRLTVILSGRDPAIETAVRVAELVTQA
jgi:hypothetical protein